MVEEYFITSNTRLAAYLLSKGQGLVTTQEVDRHINYIFSHKSLCVTLEAIWDNPYCKEPERIYANHYYDLLKIAKGGSSNVKPY